jgi:hypothetical protein
VSDLRETLDRALRAADHVEPPVEQAMRRGKGIRLRRRLTAVAAVVVVAAGAVTGYRSLSGTQALPATDPRYVTVTPPGPGSPPGLVASGMVGKQSWRITVENPGSITTPLGNICFYGRGSAFSESSTSINADTSFGPECGPLAAGDPVNWWGIPTTRLAGRFGVLAPNVAYIEIGLPDGQKLKLIPAECYGMRLVAYFTLQGPGVVTATAYLREGGHLVARAISDNP